MWDSKDPRVLKGSLVRLEIRVLLGSLGSLVPLGAPDNQVFKELSVTLEPQDPLDKMEHLDPKDQ